MNVWTGTGRLTSDPARRDTKKSVVCDFVIAVDGQPPRLWMPVTCWGDLARVCIKHLRAGRRIAVSGRLQVGEHTTPTGAKQRRWYLKAEQVTILDDSPAATEADVSGEPVQAERG